ncbi:MAG: hypothetical protein KDB27_03455 [Planctomycetales bacterium]|nr:hypothetical protein [Planctomycetales bacterium]
MKSLHRIASSLLRLSASVLIMLATASICRAQLRIVSYNTTPTLNNGLKRVLEEIGKESVNGIARPIDILALQEQGSQATDTQAILDLFNEIYGAGVYARGQVNGQGFFTQGVIYNTTTVELLEEARVGSVSSQGAARQTLRYQFRPVGYENANFYIYNSHFKANDNEVDAARRGVEAAAIRRNADTLGDAPVIFLGDFNLYSSDSPGYQALVAAGPAQANDPIDMEGSWNWNADFKIVHTQSSSVDGGDNRAGGGVNDRFDFQLVTDALMDGEGLSYIGPNVPDVATTVTQHSYRAFGNNGTHTLGRSIRTGTGASRVVLASLEAASDHLPVVVDYQLPAVLDAWVETPDRIIKGAEAHAILYVRNDANVEVPNGADELNYAVTFQDQSFAGVTNALSEPNSFRAAIDSSELGERSVDFEVATDSAMVDQTSVIETSTYSVLESSNGSFADTFDLGELVIDLGLINLGEHSKIDIPIFNIGSSTPHGAADLVIDEIDSLSPIVKFSGKTTVPAGESRNLIATIRADSVGDFSVESTIAVRDEEIPGWSFGEPMRLSFVGTVSAGDVLGDFDRNRVFDVKDLTQITDAILQQSDDAQFDLNGDGAVDQRDRLTWIVDIRKTYVGDSNLDGEFSSSDFVAVFVAGEYEDSIDGNSTWSSGDWNGDRDFDSADFVYAFRFGGYEQGPLSAIVPESCNCTLLCLALIMLCRRRVALLRQSS